MVEKSRIYRQAVYDAMNRALPDEEWFVVLQQLQALNQFVAANVVDDPTAAQALDAAIVAEIARLQEP